MCHVDRVWHVLFGLVGCESEHHSLISCSNGIDLLIAHIVLFCFERFVYTHSDIGGLFVNCSYNSAGICVKSVFCTVVADFANGITYNLLEINVCVGCNLTHYHNVSCCSTGFARYAAHRILLKQRIQNRIRNGITDFVRMSFGYRLRSKQSFFHSFSPFFLLFSFAFRSWALAFPEHFFVKKDPQFLADLNSNVQIPLLFENFAQAGTFPYRPFCLGVAAVSQILCISTTLNKRKATEFLILFFATLIHYRKIRHSSRGNKRI